jgi:hypothetical protein
MVTRSTLSPAGTVDKKTYLSLKEAALLSGLPLSYWRQLMKARAIAAVKCGGWRVLREDMERHRVMPDFAAGAIDAMSTDQRNGSA